MATQPRLVNKQFNTPINLYSKQNIQDVLDRESQILANGAVGIDFRNNPTVDKPGNLKNSAVLRMLEEEENRQRNGFGPGSKRVAWPPPNESGLDGPELENNHQSPKGAPQYSTTAQSPPSPNNQRLPTQNQPARAPLRPLDVTQRDASPLASPLANQSPRGWAPVHSPTHFQTAHLPVTQQTFLGQQYQPSAQKYQAPSPAQQYQAPPPAQQQYQAPPPAQQYQAPSPVQPQYQAPPPTQPQYQAPPPTQQQYRAPTPTQQRYQAAPPPAQQYQAAPAQQQYQAAPPVQQYRPVSQQSSESYQVSSQQHQTGPSQQYQQSQQSQTSYQTSSQQYQVSTQYHVSQQAPQVSRQVSSTTSAQVTPQSRPVFEPPPSTITLRPQPPINQAPPPLITSQPATATLKVKVGQKNLRGDLKWPPEDVKIRMIEEAQNVDSHNSFLSLEGGKHLRGDLKWPPENVKKQFEEENRLRLELATGPCFRPKKPNKDYTEFFDQHRLNSTYPGYKIPPGTQFFRPE